MNTLGMFARRPVPGQTKTRLAATIGNESAATLYAAFVEDLIARCSSLAERFVVAATPNDKPTSDWFLARLPCAEQLIFQPEGNLGDRIKCFFESAIQNDDDKVVLIGSDSPDIPSTIIESAFAELATNDVVISPACDGGFVLIGLSVQPQTLFRNIPWSESTTLCRTLEACSALGFSVKQLPLWYDIDTAENLGTLVAMQRTGHESAGFTPNTVAVLESMDWLSMQARSVSE